MSESDNGHSADRHWSDVHSIQDVPERTVLYLTDFSSLWQIFNIHLLGFLSLYDVPDDDELGWLLKIPQNIQNWSDIQQAPDRYSAIREQISNHKHLTNAEEC